MYSPLSGDHADPGGGVLPTEAHARAPTRDPWPVQQKGLWVRPGSGLSTGSAVTCCWFCVLWCTGCSVSLSRLLTDLSKTQKQRHGLETQTSSKALVPSSVTF